MNKAQEVEERNTAARFLIRLPDPATAAGLCNELRRALLSRVEGTAVTDIKVDGLAHEYGAIPGVREDGVRLAQNLKRLHVRLNGLAEATLRLAANSPGVVKAGDFSVPDGVEIANPGLPIAVLSPGGRLSLSATVRLGAGYNRAVPPEPGAISLDALYNPVEHVHCAPVDGGVQVDVRTNGVATPSEALAQAMTLCGVSADVREMDLPAGPAPAMSAELAQVFTAGIAGQAEEPDLLSLPRNSYARFVESSLPEMISSFFPVSDSQTRYVLSLVELNIRPPAHDPLFCKEQDITYAHSVSVKLRLDDGTTGESVERDLDLCDLPAMTESAAFIVHGAYRCVVSQLRDGMRYTGPGEILSEYLGELLQRMRPVVCERLNAGTSEQEGIAPGSQVAERLTDLLGEIVDLLGIDMAVGTFFTADERSQYADQTNPLSLLTHARRLALPDLYEKISEPLPDLDATRVRILMTARSHGARLVRPLQYGRVDPFESPEGPNVGLIHSLAANASVNDSNMLREAYLRVSNGVVSDEIAHLTADEERDAVIADYFVERDASGRITCDRVPARRGDTFGIYEPQDIAYIDASPIQPLGASTALTPFLGNDDGMRAVLASNMERQAVPLVETESPLICTGMEDRVARDSGALVTASGDGTVTEVSADRIVVHTTSGDRLYRLRKFERGNQDTVIDYRSMVKPGDKVREGQVLAAGPSTTEAGLALGRNILVALMPFHGYNFEDAIAISEDLVSDDTFTSLHLRKIQGTLEDTDAWLVPEGSYVRSGDVLVQATRGKRQALLTVPQYTEGRVVKVIRRGGYVSVLVAERSVVMVGDKFAGRHGNKGVVARILPREEMPFMDDGTPVQMVLNPMGVISRHNMGQIFETHCGLAARKLGTKLQVPSYGSPDEESVRSLLRAAGVPESGMVPLFDGRTGKQFDSPVTVGYLYMMKLAHMVQDKIHARATGPYCLTTGQPTGGRTSFGGQRFGKLEILAMEAYGAWRTLDEAMTVKSDASRAGTNACLLYGECDAVPDHHPQSLETLESIFRGLALNAEAPADDPVLRIALASPESIVSQSGGEVTVPEAYNGGGAAARGGLFDPDIFGVGGRRTGHVCLADPIFHPWFADHIRLLLGREELPDAATTRDILAGLDLEALSIELRNAFAEDSGPRTAQRLRLVCRLLESHQRPEWMVPTVLPVVPPSARPLVKFSDEYAVGSELNELYRTVISRNNRLKSMPAGGRAGGRMRANEVRMLQEAVDALIGSDKCEPGSLTEFLASRRGLLNRNLEGKRVDYSGRSVLVSSPNLRLDECGLPVAMAVELFRPFISRKLIEQGMAYSIEEAAEIIDSRPLSPDVRQAMEAVADERLLLLNRAPTLHRLGIQPFKPVLVDDKAIGMHPLVTYAFNADFDGDQAAIHIPLSAAALNECRRILDSALNLVSPGTGEPIASPVQDMVLGLYYLTADPTPNSPSVRFESLDEAVAAADRGLPIHTRIELPVDGGVVETTAGRAVLNSALPEPLRFVNQQMGRRELWSLAGRCADLCGRRAAVELLNALDDLGFRYATLYSPTLSIGNLQPLARREPIIAATWKRDSDIRRKLAAGEMDHDVAMVEIWRVWQEAFGEAAEAVKSRIPEGGQLGDPPYAIIASGARGGNQALARLLGIYGTAVIPTDFADGPSSVLPIASNPMIGFDPLEHFGIAWTARLSLVKTYMGQDDTTGIMTQLIAMNRDLYVTAEDCGTDSGMLVEPVERNGKPVEGIADRIAGRCAAEDITAGGKVLIRKGDLIGREAARAVEEIGTSAVRIRTVLSCREPNGVCSKCYGVDLSTGKPVAMGAAVGIISAQALLELAHQLTTATSYFTMPPVREALPVLTEEYYGLRGLIRLLNADGIPVDEEWLTRAIVTIYREQGVPLNDKHCEVIARLMGRFVRVTDPGDTLLLPGEAIKASDLEKANARASESGVRPAKGEPTMLGVHESAVMGTDSFLVRAMLSDAPGILSDAAISAAEDRLAGIRERIITGLPI